MRQHLVGGDRRRRAIPLLVAVMVGLLVVGCAGANPGSALTTFIPTAAHDRALAMTVTVPDAGWVYDNIALGFTKGSEVNNVPEATIALWSFPAGTEYWVYGDPCRWASTKPEVPATSADAIVAGLAGQASRDASEVADVAINGYTGKSVTLHVPDDAVFADCDSGYFTSYGVTGDELTRTHQGPGQIDEFWVVDVRGATAVIDAMYRADTPAAMVDQMRAIAQSIVFQTP